MGSGFGGVALAHLLGASDVRADEGEKPAADLNGGLHHRAKVKRVIQLFMNGGASPMDTFDYKPRLAELHGQTFDPGTGAKVESVTGSPGFKVLKSPFEFKQYGQSGRWVSSVFPHLAGCVDDLAFLMSMASKTNVHGPASYMQNTGFVLPGFPCMGAWIGYGLGSLSDNLPTFVVIPDPKGLPYNNQGNFSAGFLPVKHQGTIIRPHLPNPIADLFPPKSATHITPESERDGHALLAQANRATSSSGRATRGWKRGSPRTSWPPACSSARPRRSTYRAKRPRRTSCTDWTRKPTEAFGRNCLIARRLVERGVRFVQVWSGAGRPDRQLGQSRQHRRRTDADGLGHRQAVRRAGQGSESPGPAGRHAAHLDHRVRPDALQPGHGRPRS